MNELDELRRFGQERDLRDESLPSDLDVTPGVLRTIRRRSADSPPARITLFITIAVAWLIAGLAIQQANSDFSGARDRLDTSVVPIFGGLP